jgi:polyisoprenoid-binding protein YceI
MKDRSIRIPVLIVICMMMGIGLSAQSAYTLKGSGQSMKLSGTSTLHKWDMNTKTCAGNALFNFKPGSPNSLSSIKSLSFSLPVLNLKSGEKALDRNAYKALKEDKFKNIIYKLTSSTVKLIKDNRYLVKTHGNLSVAGVTKDVAMDVYCTVNKDQTITCSGSNKMKMSDYNVKPPSFMGGAMKTGNNITLDFTVVYNK